MHAHETTDCILSLDQGGVSKQTRKNLSYWGSVNKEMSIKFQLNKTISQHRIKYILQGGLLLLSVTTLLSVTNVYLAFQYLCWMHTSI